MSSVTKWRQRHSEDHASCERPLLPHVTFPSFHAGAAPLLGWGFWPVARLRWPLVTLNVVMAASAIPIGGHYVVDIIAGVMVAAAGIAVARMLERRRPGAASDPRS